MWYTGDMEPETVQQFASSPHTTDAEMSDITDADLKAFRELISRDLTPEQQRRITETDRVYPRQEAVLAVHWHPEFVPMDLIQRRIDTLFPNRQHELIIPTQHNALMSYGNYAGVEVDCYSRSFRRKVQLLIHFHKDRVRDATVFESMLAYTFKYRASQLFEFIDTIVEPAYEERFNKAVRRAGADEETIAFVRTQTRKLRQLYFEHEADTPREAVRNKLLTNFITSFRGREPDVLVTRAEAFVRTVKREVKMHFSPDFFYGTQDVIDEVRALGGCIVIPHPEQFWPILLADYDVDGYEVWNPQSRDYTAFLINVVNRQNKARKRGSRPILIFMGDDCHMGEKTKEPRFQDVEKASREIGVQYAWDDLTIRKSLIVANTNRQTVIEDYKERLNA